MDEIIEIKEKNKYLLDNFIKNEMPTTFRYFNKRTIDVIKNHLLTILLLVNDLPIGYAHIDYENKYWLSGSRYFAIDRISMARFPSGMRCSRFAFILLAGMIHKPFSVISLRSPLITSPDLFAFSIRNSRAKQATPSFSLKISRKLGRFL